MNLETCVYYSFAVAALSILTPSPAYSASESLDSLSGIAQHRQVMTVQPGSDHWYSEPQISVGIKSSNKIGTASQFGQSIRSREEFFLGAKTAKGWGVYAMGATVVGNSHGHGGNSGDQVSAAAKVRSKSKPLTASEDPNLPPSQADNNGPLGSPYNRTGVQDPSLALVHPLYDNGTVSLSGMLKGTFPVSDNSITNHVWGQGYYSILGIRMKNRYHFSNVLMFHHAIRDSYAPPFDSVNSTGITTGISRHLRSWCRVGFGQHSQVDIRQDDGPIGSFVELFTSADFILNPGVFAGPRIHFPIASQNAVSLGDMPTTPSIGNIQFEFYLQASL